MVSDPATTELLNRLRNRFFGKYRGTVTNVDAVTLRIKAEVPAVLGSGPTEWCMPCVPYAGPNVGIAFLPEVGAGVWIELRSASARSAWRGCWPAFRPALRSASTPMRPASWCSGKPAQWAWRASCRSGWLRPTGPARLVIGSRSKTPSAPRW
jgi:Type VI secretion system/phage-baseplate injector OB domain